MGNGLDQIAGLMNSNSTSTSYTQSLWNNLQSKINDGSFENASNYLVIQKENSSTGIYEDIGVRITVPYQLSQRYTIKDDCRELIFKSNDVENNLGDMYQFNGFYWITVDTGRVETPTNSCQLERCNATLKFYDTNGDYNEIPCIAQSKQVYDVQRDKYIWIPDGKMRVLVKYCDVSKKINLDRRFILNGLPWRVGSKDTVTYVRNNQGYMEMFFASDAESPNDDMTNEIADSLIQKAVYSLSVLNGSSIQVDISNSLQLDVQVIKTIDGVSTVISPTPSIVYSSSDITIVTVDSNGLVTFLQIGTVTITAKLSSDNTVQSNISVEGVSTPQNNYTIVLESTSQPDTEIKLNSSKTYSASLYNNSVLVSDSLFDFVLDQGSTPSSAFVYSVLSDNSVQITCKQYTYNLVLTAYLRSDHNVMQTKTIKLRGLI